MATLATTVRSGAYDQDVQKKLVAIGNSVALFIDKDLRHQLRLNANSLVQVRTDGQRLIIEPDGERPARGAPSMTEQEAIAMHLPQEFETMFVGGGLSPERFRRLHHCPAEHPEELVKRRGLNSLLVREMHMYLSWLQGDAAKTPTAAEWATMRRFHALYQVVAKGGGYIRGEEYALEQVPMVRDPEARPVVLR